MAILSDILSDVRRRMAESLDVRTVITGDADVPASLLPAAKILLVPVAADSVSRAVTTLDAQVKIQLEFPPKTDEAMRNEFAHKAVAALMTDGYPQRSRILKSPLVKHKNGGVSIVATIRWSERSE